MKDISTLVEDTQELFNGHKFSEALGRFSEDLGKSFALKFNEYAEERKPTLRLSNYGKPTRQLFYELNNYPKEKLSSSVKFKFLFGTILEELLLLLAAEAGHTVTDLQKEVEVDGVLGHIDAVIDGVLVDVKSASTYSFNKFKTGGLRLEGGDPFGYLEQISAYSKGMGGLDAGFLVVDKTLGNIHFEPFSKTELESYNPSRKIADVRFALTQKEPPERCYKPVPVSKTDKSGNLVLDTGCSYCGFKEECWKDSNNGEGLKTFAYSYGPKFFVEIKKTPRVDEIKKEEDNSQ